MAASPPGLPSAQQLAAQGLNALNSLFQQFSGNPLALLAAPVIAPLALSGQMGQKIQGGTLVPKTTNVATPFSGAIVQLQPGGTLVAGAQLVNNGPGTLGVTTDPGGGSQFPVLQGQPFNFGSIDLGAIYIAGFGGNNAKVSVVIYSEQ